MSSHHHQLRTAFQVIKSARWPLLHSLVAVAIFEILSVSVQAQTPDLMGGTNLNAPAVSAIDANGVNLLNGSFNIRTPVISLGPKDGSSNFFFQWSGRQWFPNVPTISRDNDWHVFISYAGGSAEFKDWVKDPPNSNIYRLTQVRPESGATLKCVVESPISGQSWPSRCIFVDRDGTEIRFYGNRLSYGSYPSTPSNLQKQYDQFGNMLMWPMSMVPAGGKDFVLYEYQNPHNGVGVQLNGRVNIRFADGSRVITTDNYNKPSITYKLERYTTFPKTLVISTPNLDQNNQDNTFLRPKSVVQTIAGSDGAAYSYTFNGSGDITRIQTPMGRVINLTYDADHRVKTYNIGSRTWSYNYNFSINATGVGTTTVTNPDGTTKQVTHDHKNGPVTVINDELQRISTYTYDGVDRLWIIQPAGAPQVTYNRSGVGNIESVWTSGVGPLLTISSATYPTNCTVPSYLCTMPLTTTSANGGVTKYEYSADGTIKSVEAPPDSAGKVAKVTYEFNKILVSQRIYGASPATFPEFNNNTQNFYRTRRTVSRQCLDLDNTNCENSADEIVERVVYGASGTEAYPTKLRSELGNGTLLKETTFTYDNQNNVVAKDGPLLGDVDKSYIIYDAMSRPIYEISPIPNPTDSNPLPRIATKRSYNAESQETLVETGTITDITFDGTYPEIPVDVEGFTMKKAVRRTYDPVYGELQREETIEP
jgi:hypothetical protein